MEFRGKIFISNWKTHLTFPWVYIFQGGANVFDDFAGGGDENWTEEGTFFIFLYFLPNYSTIFL